MAKGNDSRRKIHNALAAMQGRRATAQTKSELRKELGLQCMNGKDFEMNLLAMNGAGDLVECNLRAPHVSVALA